MESILIFRHEVRGAAPLFQLLSCMQWPAHVAALAKVLFVSILRRPVCSLPGQSPFSKSWRAAWTRNDPAGGGEGSPHPGGTGGSEDKRLQTNLRRMT